MVEADPALGRRPEPAAQFRPIGFDPGYALGLYVPRTMNRLATILATAVILGLLPVSIWAYATRLPAAAASTASDPSTHAVARTGQGNSR